MSVRSLGSLLTRRFSPRGIPRAQAQAKILGPGVISSSLIQRDLAVGDGAYGGVGVAAAALTGLSGILYFLKGGDKSAGEVIGEESLKQGSMMEAAVKEDNDGDFSLEKYLVEMTELAAAQEETRYNREMPGKKVLNNEVAKSEAMTEEDIKEETAMKTRFEDWIKEYGRRYKNEEEKARRYELFKAFAKMVDKANAQSGGAKFVTNHTADWTEQECRCLYDNDVDWDDYLDHIQSLIDKRK